MEAVEDLTEAAWEYVPIFVRPNGTGNFNDYRAFRCGASQRIYDGILKAKEAEKQTKATQELVLVGNAIAKKMFDELQFEKTDMRETAPRSGTEASYLHGYIRGSAVNPKGMKRKEIE